MKLVSWLGVAALALFATSCATHTYNSPGPGGYGTYDVMDFNGDWQLVTSPEGSRYDYSRTPSGSELTRYGAWFLPDEIRIDGNRDQMRIEDPNGNLIAEIDMQGNYRSGYSNDRDRDQDRDRDDRNGGYNNGYGYGSSNGTLQAHWLNDHRFEVDRPGRNGHGFTQTFTLTDRGQLVVGTQVSRNGGTRNYTRVYERA